MVAGMLNDGPLKDGDTRDLIKRTALVLFARDGLEGVSIRDIVRAAGQKNTGSVHYYFASKEALARELAGEIAQIIDTHRHRRIDAMEAAGGPRAVRDVLDILIRLPHEEPGDLGFDTDMAAFVDMMMAKHPDLIFEGIHVELGLATRRCLAHLRHMLPALPSPLMEQRFRFAILYAFSILSSRRSVGQRPDLWPPRWTEEVARQNLLDTLEGLLRQPASPETMAALAPAPKRPSRKR
ncbi:TetR/AcrR family transcriptional regulator [Oleomonas cavernae]|uniref:TetR/AcrR family transcriptional regulator n=1 Tax=Oleomonas cavernae TaxID=2320859 RepID=A0A418WCR3_9PROT|nr:TetR/AcrR family transcriptional regulator [Oleomonas cavernae]RJF87759.1 TetR/AcrR family transcriptional regulator [Oleomonas cavernae]